MDILIWWVGCILAATLLPTARSPELSVQPVKPSGSDAPQGCQKERRARPSHRE
ncbi:hypothetical protein TRM7615_01860 [Falsiruegeria mediterranea M17]|uniref:Uncharacterized protein n=1 Tax=Falsiruegeria mediterranea M17 TaxID=1200281 RepID=A0A2R8C7F3_9RHOB|nr:hypothetical protein TRM7615_01860 [Falsiruegeria mediterranea M17]